MTSLEERVAAVIDAEAFGEDVEQLYNGAARIPYDRELANKARWRSGGLMGWGVRRARARELARAAIAVCAEEMANAAERVKAPNEPWSSAVSWHNRGCSKVAVVIRSMGERG